MMVDASASIFWRWWSPFVIPLFSSFQVILFASLVIIFDSFFFDCFDVGRVVLQGDLHTTRGSRLGIGGFLFSFLDGV